MTLPSWIAGLSGVKYLEVNGTPVTGTYDTLNVIQSGASGAANTSTGAWDLTLAAGSGGAGTVVTAKVATTANHPLSGTANVDGVAISAGQTVLVRTQTAPAQNGLYTVAAGAWSRHVDFTVDADFVPGFSVYVLEGATYAQTRWAFENTATPTVGSTALSFGTEQPYVDAAVDMHSNGIVNASEVVVGAASADASAALHVDSTTKGMLPPRMTTTERNAIASPATGLTVYNTTTARLENYNGASWEAAGAQTSGVNTFVALTDTPANFTSAGNRIVGVNAGATAIEFKGVSKLAATDTLWFEPQTVDGSGADVYGAVVLGVGDAQYDASGATTSEGSVVIGPNVIGSATQALESVAVGGTTAVNATALNRDILIGFGAGATLGASGGGNILIGAVTDVPTATESYHLNIGNVVYSDMNNAYVRIGGYGALTATSTLHLTRSDPSTAPLLKLETTGTNGAGVEHYVGTIVPTFSAPSGSKYTYVNGASSADYINQSASSPGTTWTLQASASQHMPTGAFYGRFRWASTSTVSLDAGYCRDDTDSEDIVWGSTLTANIASSGLNGLDTGTESADTWYYVYVVNNGVTPGLLISASPTAPTMPSGYTAKRFAGIVRNNASSNFLNFACFGVGRDREYIYSDPLNSTQVLSGGSSTTIAAVSLASYVPPYAATRSRRVLIHAECKADTAAARVAVYPVSGSAVWEQYCQVTGTYVISQFYCPTDPTTNQIQYDWIGTPTNPVLDLYVAGFEDTI